ncbi:unnamed protein product [Wuchereria bancrofti]|uniref:Uncharacterized protein n=1 Tax=Wuchereria bancrofti TaxID=6293 RepID=A0A3P7DL22_WUCBA|nr:unnamed protein product [Wuchereria bancrofti]
MNIRKANCVHSYYPQDKNEKKGKAEVLKLNRRGLILDSGLHSVSNTEDGERKVGGNNCPDEVAGIAIDVAVVTNGGAAAVHD